MWPSHSGTQTYPLGSFCRGQRLHGLCLSHYVACCGFEISTQGNPGGKSRCIMWYSTVYYIWIGFLVTHTGCGLHVCPGSRAMSMVLSGKVMRNSSESTSVPSSSQTRDRDTADRDSSRAWQTWGTCSLSSYTHNNQQRIVILIHLIH